MSDQEKRNVYKLGTVDYHGAKCEASINWTLKEDPKGLIFSMSATLEEVGKNGRVDVEDLPKSKANRDERGILAMWIRKDEHPLGLLCVPCPVCGYKFGSEWKFEELPAAVIDEIKSWG